MKDAFLTIDLETFWKDVEDSLERLQAARAMVVSDPEILSERLSFGAPVFPSTMWPPPFRREFQSAGFLQAYPSLQQEHVELAAIYAEANPQRGRPRLRSVLPPSATILTQRKKPRIPATA